MTFEEWNISLARFFFNSEHAGKRVYLHTTKELLRELAGNAQGVEDFIKAIKRGPNVTQRGEMCATAVALYTKWRAPGNLVDEYPSYIAYLCFFALAAGHDGNWPRHAYYPRVWDLLGESNAGAPPQFRPMSDLLWRDLEVWTHVDKKGELGLFKWQSALDWIYVGLPVAQTILTDEERRVLPELFEQADLEPGAVLPEGQLAAILGRIAGRRLRRQTVQLLGNSGTSDYRMALLEILQGELLEWDGSVQKTAEESSERRAGLRLWLKEIDPTGFIESRVVAFLPESLGPDEMLIESRCLPGKSFVCPAQSGRVTDALREAESNSELQAEVLKWENRIEFRCVHTGARLIFPASFVRIFASGGTVVTGFIETRKVPSQGEFFVAAHTFAAREIEDWGMRCCRAWGEVRTTTGLPSGWRLFHATDSLGDGGLGSRYPALVRSASPRIGIEGGVRSGNGAAYFPFALPEIVVDWHERPSSVRCNGQVLRSNDGVRYHLDPEHTQAVNQIEAEIGALRIQSMLFVVSDGWRWGEGTECPNVNRYGSASLEIEDTFRVRGALVTATGVPEFIPDPETFLEETGRAVLLGRVPGQVVDLRRGQSLPSWSAVWAVTITRRRVVFAYCGTSIDVCQPEVGQSDGNPKRWASIIWVSRKRTEPLKHPRVRELLSAYREVARAI
jgi:hypothetical protein